MMTSSNGNIFRITGPLCGELDGHQWISLTRASTVYSRYNAVGGVQGMVPRYKWERDISGHCHEPKSDSILQRFMNDNGAFVCLVANSARRQLI